ncbi:MAG: ATP synthase F1 subunit gamma, partial [Deltaproteobacteria bacterium]|nr:ATP synthase F1 subunit gamma [Deltaproteobacteria bacterium]
AFRPYAEKFAEVLGSLAGRAPSEANPLLIPREEVHNVHVVLCTSDRGLCGGFNLNLIETAEKLAAEEAAAGRSVSFTNFGKKGRDWARKADFEIVEAHLNVVGGRIPFATAVTTGRQLVDLFLDGTYDEVYVIYALFESMARQTPVVQKLLPIPAITTTVDADAPYMAEHICEPSPAKLLGTLLPRNVFVQLYKALLETSTSEHAARMMAMDNATKACNDMIERLTLAYNKARQAAITAELMDIVGGAEALKG